MRPYSALADRLMPTSSAAVGVCSGASLSAQVSGHSRAWLLRPGDDRGTFLFFLFFSERRNSRANDAVTQGKRSCLLHNLHLQWQWQGNSHRGAELLDG